MSNQAEVDELVRRAKDGDMAAFDGLACAFQGPMFNLAYRMIDNREEANDLTQEIFVKMYRSIRKFRGKSKFSTWLYAVAVNTCRSRMRRLRRVSRFEVTRLDDDGNGGQHSGSIDPVDPEDSPGERLEREEIKQQVGQVVAALPEDFRTVIIMRDMQALSYEEISTVLGCSIGTVKSRLSRARIRVKEKLSRKGFV